MLLLMPGASPVFSESGPGYEIFVELPGIAREIPTLLDSLNTLSLEAVNDFRSTLGYLREEDPLWLLDLRFSHEPSPDGLVCILFTEYHYNGGAHGMEGFTALVYRLEDDGFIEPLSLIEDLPGFARAVRDSLLKNPDADPGWIGPGTEPIAQNYRAVLPFPDSTGALMGFQVVFPAYQVAPYSAGVHRVRVPMR